ncbi:uncharacterized protein FYW61_013948 isoform 2-T3 [Anableps anableps]
MSKIVSKYRGNSLQLCSPAKAILTIGPIEDTEYKNRPAVVNGWGKFYLPTTATMEVIGYVEGTPYPCDKLVLMTCQDQKVYVYDEDELHLVASSLKEMCTKGIAFPPFQSYYHGEAFKDMTKEDWEEVKKGPVGKRLDEEHRKLVASHKSTLLQDLKIIRQKQRCHQQYSSSLPNNILTQSQKGRT